MGGERKWREREGFYPRETERHRRRKQLCGSVRKSPAHLNETIDRSKRASEQSFSLHWVTVVLLLREKKEEEKKGWSLLFSVQLGNLFFLDSFDDCCLLVQTGGSVGLSLCLVLKRGRFMQRSQL